MSRRWRYKSGDSHDKLEKFGRMRSRSRKSKTSRVNANVEFEVPEKDWPSIEGGFAARVVEVHKRYAFVSSEPTVGRIDTSDVWLGRVARRFLTADRYERNFVSVGDRVWCRPALDKEKDNTSELPQCVIELIAPRKTKISRRDPLLPDREHVLATNVDQILIVASFLAPRVKWGLIDRYLILAECQEVDAVIILNKLDLLEEDRADHPEFYEECRKRAEYYRNLGYTVYEMQANADGAEDAELTRALVSTMAGKVSMTSGHSGVGKSSVINLLDPEIVQDVEPDSDIFYKGRHTTTYASFIQLGGGGYVIDTPGIRSFVIQQQSAITLSFGFRDIRPYAQQCHYRECRHVDEPGCKVLEAVEDGKIAAWRYHNYLGILLGTTGREGRLREQE